MLPEPTDEKCVQRVFSAPGNPDNLKMPRVEEKVVEGVLEHASYTDGDIERLGKGRKEIDEGAVIAEGENRTSWLIWLLVMCSAISSLLFGAFS